MKAYATFCSGKTKTGRVEYKRQVHSSSAARLRSLATQMSYRLDEGHGLCCYRVGVEDNGCHSLLDYATVAESARILECIARSLNAVVVERKIIQNEVVNDNQRKYETKNNKDIGAYSDCTKGPIIRS